jgi:hypothetical protein
MVAAGGVMLPAVFNAAVKIAVTHEGSGYVIQV